MMIPLRWQYHDGGRKEAGYKGRAGDCGVRAVAIATGLPYQEVYDAINEFAKSERPRKGRSRSDARTGVWRRTLNKYLESLGWKWVPTMQIGSGCQVHMRKDELPTGPIIVRLSKHFAAVYAGVVLDVGDPTRGGNRCVYGYWEYAGGKTQ